MVISDQRTAKAAAPAGGIGFFEKWLSVWVALCIIAGMALGAAAPGGGAAEQGYYAPGPPVGGKKYPRPATTQFAVFFREWRIRYPLLNRRGCILQGKEGNSLRPREGRTSEETCPSLQTSISTTTNMSLSITIKSPD